MDSNEVIEQSKLRFDNETHTEGYKKVHEDQNHLDSLMALLDVVENRKYLDLGTGNGYLAFEMNRRFPKINIIGLDIIKKAIEKDNELVESRNLENIHFISYGGKELPFENAEVFGTVSRHAFHHFPDPSFSVKELFRITSENGFLLLSDPIAIKDDSVGFVDSFQKLKADGHVHFHAERGIDSLFMTKGFKVEKQFFSHVSFKREKEECYLSLIQGTPASILKKYGVVIQEKEVQITLTVKNTVYRK